MELYKSKYSDRKKSGRDEKSYRSFRNSRDDRNSRYSRDDRGESTTVTCADCGTQCQVPFVPRTDKPVYCSDCFRQNKPQDSRDDRNSRYSRDDRNSRYSRDDRNSRYSRDDRNSRYSRDDRNSRYSRDDRNSRSSYRRESSRDNSRSRKPKNDKFLRKQESFFSNGSDKFYATIKEKLFEILGGKSCSSCGFKDERALGISPISNDASFDSNGRGGTASSWGKYISSPELAREELKVLCLNCNEIREPISKPKQDQPKSKQKKSKYFPR